MTSTEWGIILGLFSSWLMLLLPWLMTVHARLAVVVAMLRELQRQVQTLAARLESRTAHQDDAASDRSPRPVVCACPLSETTLSATDDAA